MEANNGALDEIENALFSCIRITKRQAYWDEFQRLADTSIDRPAAHILLILDTHPIQFQDLVNRLGVEAPSVSRKVHELENDGLVRRQSTSDKRVHLLSLTDEGRDVTKRLQIARRAIMSEIVSSWSEKDRKQLSDLLTRLTEDLSKRFNSRKVQE